LRRVLTSDDICEHLGILAANSLVAQSEPPIKVNVPFNFVVDAKTLPQECQASQ
jgi:hypothetical protein